MNENDWLGIANDFWRKWNVVNCCGALDGKHILIRAPEGTGSQYFNYKSQFSIVLLAVVNANYEFIFVDVGTNGRVSDGGVFAQSKLGKAISKNKLPLPPKKKL